VRNIIDLGLDNVRDASPVTSNNSIGVPLDDMYDEIQGYTMEGVGRQDAIAYATYRRGMSLQEHDARCRTIKAVLSAKDHRDLGHLMDF